MFDAFNVRLLVGRYRTVIIDSNLPVSSQKGKRFMRDLKLRWGSGRANGSVLELQGFQGCCNQDRVLGRCHFSHFFPGAQIESDTLSS